MGVFMAVEICPLLFAQRMLHRIADKKQRKMKMLLLIVTAPGVGAQTVRVHAEGNRHHSPL